MNTGEIVLKAESPQEIVLSKDGIATKKKLVVEKYSRGTQNIEVVNLETNQRIADPNLYKWFEEHQYYGDKDSLRFYYNNKTREFFSPYLWRSVLKLPFFTTLEAIQPRIGDYLPLTLKDFNVHTRIVYINFSTGEVLEKPNAFIQETLSKQLSKEESPEEKFRLELLSRKENKNKIANADLEGNMYKFLRRNGRQDIIEIVYSRRVLNLNEGDLSRDSQGKVYHAFSDDQGNLIVITLPENKEVFRGRPSGFYANRVQRYNYGHWIEVYDSNLETFRVFNLDSLRFVNIPFKPKDRYTSPLVNKDDSLRYVKHNDRSQDIIDLFIEQVVANIKPGEKFSYNNGILQIQNAQKTGRQVFEVNTVAEDNVQISGVERDQLILVAASARDRLLTIIDQNVAVDKYDLFDAILHKIDDEIVTKTKQPGFTPTGSFVFRLDSQLSNLGVDLQQKIRDHLKRLEVSVSGPQGQTLIRQSLHSIVENIISYAASGSNISIDSRAIEILAAIDNAEVLSDSQNQTELLTIADILDTAGIKNPLQRRQIIRLAGAYSTRKDRNGKNVFVMQLEKLAALPQTADLHPLVQVVGTLSQEDSSKVEAYFRGEDVQLAQNVVGYAYFLTHDSELLVIKDKQEISGGNLLLPGEQVNFATIIDLFRNKGMTSIYDVIKYQRANKNTPPEEIRQEVLKETSAQANETGVVTRELGQNASDGIKTKINPPAAVRASVSSPGLDEGRIIIRNYKQIDRSNNTEYVEEIQDNGAGILDILSIIVPRLSGPEKRAQVGSDSKALEGFFGSGKYKTLEDTDKKVYS